MKHLPAVLPTASKADGADAEKSDVLTDSAHETGTEKDSPSGATEQAEATRPDSRLGPLPTQYNRDPSPLRQIDSAPDTRSSGAVASSGRSIASTSKSKSLSIRTFFRNKKKGDKLWSGYD